MLWCRQTVSTIQYSTSVAEYIASFQSQRTSSARKSQANQKRKTKTKLEVSLVVTAHLIYILIPESKFHIQYQCIQLAIIEYFLEYRQIAFLGAVDSCLPVVTSVDYLYRHTL